MNHTGTISLIILLANFIFSYKGFANRAFFERYSFEIERVLVFREYRRLITSGFLHVSWSHFLFNMISLLAFCFLLEKGLGSIQFCSIYFGSLLTGNLLSLLIHRHDSDYSSVGASGAICGVIFATIAIYPGISISIMGLLAIPGWLYGLFFVLISVYGIKSRQDNIGHDAHLGGALAGMLIALFFEPHAIWQNFTTILVISIPCLFFIYIIITRPYLLLVDNLFYRKHHNFANIDHRYNFERANKQKELDMLLEKIHTKGINSLSKAERERLEQYSQEMN